jgi:hypothetical protein
LNCDSQVQICSELNEIIDDEIPSSQNKDKDEEDSEEYDKENEVKYKMKKNKHKKLFFFIKYNFI